MNRFSSLGPSSISTDPQAPPESSPSGISSSSLTSSPLRQPTRFFLPVRYEPNYRYPLIVWLHSDGYNENQISQVLPHISLQNYLGVGIRGSRSIDPAGHRFDWALSPAAMARCEDALWDAIDQALQRYSVHPQRVFIAGYGSGGTVARQIALKHADAFAGCIALGGRFPRASGLLSNLPAARRLPHLWSVAVDNPTVTNEQFTRDVELIAAAGLKMDIRRYTSDDEMVSEVLRDVDRWVMRHVTGTKQHDWQTVPVGFSEN